MIQLYIYYFLTITFCFKLLIHWPYTLNDPLSDCTNQDGHPGMDGPADQICGGVICGHNEMCCQGRGGNSVCVTRGDRQG